MLLSLPPEIVLGIAAELEQSTLCSLRLACKSLNLLTLDSFGTRSFATLRTDLTPASLERIKLITEQDSFSRAVRSLSISTEHSRNKFGTGFYWHRDLSGCLAGGLPGVELFRQVMGQLPKHTSFDIDILNPIGEDESTEYISRCDAIAITLHLIAVLKMTPKSFRLHSYQWPKVLFDARRLSFIKSEDATHLMAAWAQLEELDLSLQYHSELTALIDSLLQPTPNDRRLKLHLICNRNIDWLTRFCTSSRLGRLEELSLQGVSVPEACLTAFLLSVRESLKTLRFFCCRLDDSSWPKAFRKWIGCFPVLETFSFLRLEHNIGGYHVMAFPYLHKDPWVAAPSKSSRMEIWRPSRAVRYPIEVTYKGTEIDLALETLARSCYDMAADHITIIHSDSINAGS